MCDNLLKRKGKRNPPPFIKRLPEVNQSNRFTLNALGSIDNRRKRSKYSSVQTSPRELEHEDSREFPPILHEITSPSMSNVSPVRNQMRSNSHSLSPSKVLNSSLSSYVNSLTLASTRTFDSSTLDKRVS